MTPTTVPRAAPPARSGGSRSRRAAVSWRVDFIAGDKGSGPSRLRTKSLWPIDSRRLQGARAVTIQPLPAGSGISIPGRTPCSRSRFQAPRSPTSARKATSPSRVEAVAFGSHPLFARATILLKVGSRVDGWRGSHCGGSGRGRSSLSTSAGGSYSSFEKTSSLERTPLLTRLARSLSPGWLVRTTRGTCGRSCRTLRMNAIDFCWPEECSPCELCSRGISTSITNPTIDESATCSSASRSSETGR